MFQRVALVFCVAAAREPYYRVSCVLLKSRLGKMLLYNWGVERDMASEPVQVGKNIVKCIEYVASDIG